MFTLSSKTTITITQPTTTGAESSDTLASKTSDLNNAFSDLLHGFQFGKKTSKEGELEPLDLKADTELDLKTDDKSSLTSKLTQSLKSNESLTSLLKGDNKTVVEDDVKTDMKTDVKLNTDLTKTLPLKDLKQLVSDAKAFLKDKIALSDDAKKAQIDDLPKTLKGLVKVAEKFGIDVSKLSMESVKEPKKQTSSVLDDSLTVDDSVELKLKNNPKNINSNIDIPDDLKSDVSKTKIFTKEIQNIPLFKAQTKTTPTVQESVNVKSTTAPNLTDIQTPKKRLDETLKMLLKGESAAKKELTGLTSDFSVATAKVIVSSKPRQQESLESLLQASGADSSNEKASKATASEAKLDSINTNTLKADSFEVKLNEAKQMTKYLSQDVKSAIDNYKAPFTRIKVQLNPQQFGEMDLTVVQRGKNLHINLSSNNAAINTLAMNANDLKVQLQNTGINNASLNFNNNSQSQDGSASQQQHSHQNRRDANEEYNYFTSNDENEEVLSSLEIVVPYYA
jgi:hypothetical protein